MGLFGGRKNFDIAHLGTAVTSVPRDYLLEWKHERKPDSGLYAIRLHLAEQALHEVRAARNHEDAVHAANFVGSKADAELFVQMVLAGQDDTLRSYALIEAHKRMYPAALEATCRRRNLVRRQFIETDEHDTMIQAACLVRLREFVTMGVWDALIQMDRASASDDVIAAELEKVRTHWKELIPGWDVPHDFYEDG